MPVKAYTAAVLLTAALLLGSHCESKRVRVQLQHRSDDQPASSAAWRSRLEQGKLKMQNPPGIRAAFVYLVNPKEVVMLATSLILLRERFLARWPYPVLLFVEESVDEQQMAAIQNTIPRGVQAYTVRLTDFATLPPGFNSSYDHRTVITNRNWPGYNHMIRFWWRQVLHHPVILSLDYYIRMDTDSWILDDVSYDFIESMYQDNVTYGFLSEAFDGPEYCRGMFDFLAQYVDSHPSARQHANKNRLWLPDPAERDEHGPHLFYNNFEAVAVQRMITNQQYMEFVDAVDASHNIYWYRWGDAPLRYYAIMLTLDYDKEVRKLCGIDYYHQYRIGRAC